MGEWISVKKASALLGISVRQVQNLAGSQKIVSRKLDDTVPNSPLLLDEASVMAYRLAPGRKKSGPKKSTPEA